MNRSEIRRRAVEELRGEAEVAEALALVESLAQRPSVNVLHFPSAGVCCRRERQYVFKGVTFLPNFSDDWSTP